MSQETIEVMEPVLFTKLSEQKVNQSKLSDLHIIIKYVAIDWGLDITRERGFATVKRIIINSVKYN